jgi:hypothetical protein
MRRSVPLVLLLSLLAFLASLWLTVMSVSVSWGERPWDAFDLILVPAGEPARSAAAALRAAGFSVQDRYSSSVQIEDFGLQEWVPVAALDERYDEADPRLDPFIRSLATLFETVSGGERYDILYIPRGDVLVRQVIELRSILGDTPFRLIGWEPVVPVVSGAGALLALLIAVPGAGKRWWLAAGIVVSGTVYAAAHGPLAMTRAILIGSVMIRWQRESLAVERQWLVHRSWHAFERRHRHATIEVLIGSVAAVLSLFILPASDPSREVWPFVLFVTGLTALASIGFFGHYARIARSEHRLFTPQSILTTHRRRGGVGASAVVGVSAIVAMVFLADAPLADSELVIPVPSHFLIAQEPLQSHLDVDRMLAAVAGDDIDGAPLSTGGYLAHRWYQSTLRYGGTFQLPARNEIVSLTRFRREGGTLVSWDEEVFRADAPWFIAQFRNDRVMAQSPEQSRYSVYRMFVAERGAFAVTRRLVQLPSLPIGDALTIALLLLGVAFFANVAIRLPYNGRIGTVAAR